MKKIIIDKEILYQLYVVEQKSLAEISEILKLNRRTVTINIENYGFKDSVKHNKRRRVDKTNNLEELKQQFYQDYICNDMTLEQLVNKYGYTRYVRTEDKAKVFPGDSDIYVPFAPNWIVKGDIINDKGVLKFDFIELLTIKDYNNMTHEDE